MKVLRYYHGCSCGWYIFAYYQTYMHSMHRYRTYKKLWHHVRTTYKKYWHTRTERQDRDRSFLTHAEMQKQNNTNRRRLSAKATQSALKHPISHLKIADKRRLTHNSTWYEIADKSPLTHTSSWYSRRVPFWRHEGCTVRRRSSANTALPEAWMCVCARASVCNVYIIYTHVRMNT